jgi:drug/metabolite transporter (DMT)-like permease
VSSQIEQTTGVSLESPIIRRWAAFAKIGDSVWLGLLALHVATVMYGSTFLAIKQAVSSVTPNVLIFWRFALAALVLAPFLRNSNLRLWRAGFENAFWLMGLYVTQTMGLQASAASQGAFINSLYVVLVPLLLRFSGRRILPVQWLAACIAILGISLLSRGNGPFTMGDLWFFASAIFAAVLVIRRGVHSAHFSSWPLTAVTIWCGLGLASLWLILAQQPLRLEGVPWTPVVYLGVLVTGLSTWLLTFGQARVSSVNSSVIFALEPVWAAGLAAVLIGERLGMLGWLGGLLVVAANVLPQWLAQPHAAFRIWPFKPTRQTR